MRVERARLRRRLRRYLGLPPSCCRGYLDPRSWTRVRGRLERGGLLVGRLPSPVPSRPFAGHSGGGICPACTQTEAPRATEAEGAFHMRETHLELARRVAPYLPASPADGGCARATPPRMPAARSTRCTGRWLRARSSLSSRRRAARRGSRAPRSTPGGVVIGVEGAYSEGTHKAHPGRGREPPPRALHRGKGPLHAR